jgi:hypothetical protein
MASIGDAALLEGADHLGQSVTLLALVQSRSIIACHRPWMDFDATITLNDHHLAAASLTDRPAEAVAAVRRAVERMPGAGWINVEAHYFPPHTPGWVTLYLASHGAPPDTPEWQELQRSVERVAKAALVAAAVPF